MWELDYKESWMPKNWCFWTVVLEKTLESPLDCKKIQPVHPKGDQSWVFFGGNDAKGEAPIHWPPHAKRWLIWEDPDAGKDWGQEEKGMTEDEMAGWHHRLNGHGFGWTLGVGDGTRRPGVLQFMGSQRIRHDWVTELNWTQLLQFRNLFLSLKWLHGWQSLSSILNIILSSILRHVEENIFPRIILIVSEPSFN